MHSMESYIQLALKGMKQERKILFKPKFLITCLITRLIDKIGIGSISLEI